MNSQLAARRLQVLHDQLEKEKAAVLGHLSLVEELARELHRESGLNLCLAILPMTDAVRREVAGLSLRSATTASQLSELTACLNSVSQMIVTHVRDLATS